MSDIKKVVLAYSGGLDTSVILQWIKDEYGAEVVAYTADVGQGEEVAEAEETASEDPMADVPPELLARPFSELSKEEKVIVARARSRAMRAKTGTSLS